jgi:hypothetical protein
MMFTKKKQKKIAEIESMILSIYTKGSDKLDFRVL